MSTTEKPKNIKLTIRIDSVLNDAILKKLRKYHCGLSDYVRNLIINDLTETEELYSIIKQELRYLGILAMKNYKSTLQQQYGDTLTDEQLDSLFAEELEDIKKSIRKKD